MPKLIFAILILIVLAVIAVLVYFKQKQEESLYE